MKHKFSLSCDDELVGYCEDIVGLNGDKIVIKNEEKYHRLELVNFQICEEYLKYLNKNKSGITGPCTIDVLDYEGVSIGEYNFNVYESIESIEQNEMEKHFNLTLIVLLNSIAIGDEIQLWDKWRNSKPEQKNVWITLSNENQEAWLNIVLKYHFSYKRSYYDPYDNISGGTYYLDGSNIKNYQSFFCALGEAMNGAGGYYGTDELNILDCLTGGFRVCAPFKLIWKNSKVASNNLSKVEWENKIKRDKENLAKVFVNDYYHSKPEQSFFDVIIEIFAEHGITVELE